MQPGRPLRQVLLGPVTRVNGALGSHFKDRHLMKGQGHWYMVVTLLNNKGF